MGNGHRQVAGHVALTLARRGARHLQHLHTRQILDVGAKHSEGFRGGVTSVLRDNRIMLILILRQAGQDRRIDLILDILLGLDLALEHHPGPHDSRRDAEAQDKGQQQDHLGIRRDRRGAAKCGLDDAEVVHFAVHADLGLLPLLLEQLEQRLDHLHAAVDLLQLELLLRDRSHLPLAAAQHLAQLLLADAVHVDQVGDGQLDSLLAVLQLLVQVEHARVRQTGIRDQAVALRDQVVVAADNVVQARIAHAHVRGNDLILARRSLSQIIGDHVQDLQLQLDLGQLLLVIHIAAHGELRLRLQAHHHAAGLIILVVRFGRAEFGGDHRQTLVDERDRILRREILIVAALLVDDADERVQDVLGAARHIILHRDDNHVALVRRLALHRRVQLLHQPPGGIDRRVPGADIFAAVLHVEGVLGQPQHQRESTHRDGIAVIVQLLAFVEILPVHAELLHLILRALHILELQIDGARLHLIGIQRIAGNLHLEGVVVVILHLLEAEEAHLEPVAQRHLALVITGIDAQLLHHFAHDRRALDDEELIIDLAGRGTPRKLRQEIQLRVVPVVLVQHNPGSTLIHRSLHTNVQEAQAEHHESGPGHPPSQSPDKLQPLADVRALLFPVIVP